MVAHIVGSGLSSLAAAVYLIKDAGVRGEEIFVYEAGDQLGVRWPSWEGGLRLYPPDGPCVRAKMPALAFELFSLIPSASDETRSFRDEIEEFRRNFPTTTGVVHDR